MRDILQLRWPDTFGGRFKLALVINLLFVCGVAFLAGLVFGPVFIPTIVILTVVALLMALLTAALATPGTSYWAPLSRRPRRS